MSAAGIHEVVDALSRLYERALARMRERVAPDGRPTAEKLEQAQLPAHALAYLATELEACRCLDRWAHRVSGEAEQRIARAYVSRIAGMVRGGIDLGACESVPLFDLGLTGDDLADTVLTPEVAAFVEAHGSSDAMLAIARHARDGELGGLGLDDTHDEVRAQFARFTDAEVIPRAQRIHLRDVLIPMDLIEQMAELGVFGLHESPKATAASASARSRCAS